MKKYTDIYSKDFSLFVKVLKDYNNFHELTNRKKFIDYISLEFLLNIYDHYSRKGKAILENEFQKK